MAKPDYVDFYHPENSRRLRSLLADKKWQEVYDIATAEKLAMGKLAILAAAYMAKEQADKLMSELEA